MLKYKYFEVSIDDTSNSRALLDLRRADVPYRLEKRFTDGALILGVPSEIKVKDWLEADPFVAKFKLASFYEADKKRHIELFKKAASLGMDAASLIPPYVMRAGRDHLVSGSQLHTYNRLYVCNCGDRCEVVEIVEALDREGLLDYFKKKERCPDCLGKGGHTSSRGGIGCDPHPAEGCSCEDRCEIPVWWSSLPDEEEDVEDVDELFEEVPF